MESGLQRPVTSCRRGSGRETPSNAAFAARRRRVRFQPRLPGLEVEAARRFANPSLNTTRPGGASTRPRYPRATLRRMEERDQTELDRSASVLDGVDLALQRLSDGTYGSCEACGAPVLDTDLERDPVRRLCEQHLAVG